ncbi:MAG TPA: ribonuclease H-like domain-containing protein [Alphaproteobacteria bacterium]|nr:ribonuclease D [Rhodospirillaceae bacterium]HRJ11704.1 ribonuclease H-like domain-containing protein [Alphaproteobacteria bacterium]
MTITVHHGDLPANVKFSGSVAVDTETMGLNHARDRLCVVQLCGHDGDVHIVRFAPHEFDAPNLVKLFADEHVVKIFHFARFDLGAVKNYLDVLPYPVYCTKIASMLVRTYTDRHSLKELCKELLGVELNKAAQSSDWGAPDLSQDQMEYAAQDVIHLHNLREKLDAMLLREGRTGLYQACVEFLPVRVMLDLAGWESKDIFAHH